MLRPSILVTLATLAFLSPNLHAQGSLIQIGPSRAPNPTLTDTLTKNSPFPDSIYIALIPNLPFTATIVGDRTSVASVTPNSTMGMIQFAGNNRLVARDTAGHIVIEQRAFIRNGQKQTSELLATDYIDPIGHHFLRCVPQKQICYFYSLRTTTQGYITYTAEDIPVLGVTPTQIAKTPGATFKTLGQKTIEGIATTGYRATFEINRCAGPCSDISRTPSSRPNTETFSSDLWYSPDLQMDLKMNYTNDAGDHTDTMKDIHRTEPDPKLFQVPAGYKVVDGASQ